MNTAISGNIYQQIQRNLPAALSKNTSESKLHSVAGEFEAIFMKQMLDSMKKTLNREVRLVDTGLAGEIYHDMLYDEYAQIMAKTGGFGLAKLIVQQYS